MCLLLLPDQLLLKSEGEEGEEEEGVSLELKLLAGAVDIPAFPGNECVCVKRSSLVL